MSGATSFQYGCFVSYRRDQLIVQRFAEDLADNLSTELQIRMDLGVFLDKAHSSGDQMSDETIAAAICRSVCMVVVYTPTYFGNAYCAREFQAMSQIETRRMQSLGSTSQGLIIPVVLRGADQLPAALKDRQVENFDRYMLGDNTTYRPPGFKKSVQTIAEQISNNHRTFKRLLFDPTKECKGFHLPSVRDVRNFVESMGPPAPPRFPFRSRS